MLHEEGLIMLKFHCHWRLIYYSAQTSRNKCTFLPESAQPFELDMNMTETGNQSFNVDLSATLDSADSIESGVSHLKDKPFQAQEAQCEAKSGEYVTSNFSGGYNLVNTIVGSGIIGLPYAIQLSGATISSYIEPYILSIPYILK